MVYRLLVSRLEQLDQVILPDGILGVPGQLSLSDGHPIEPVDTIHRGAAQVGQSGGEDHQLTVITGIKGLNLSGDASPEGGINLFHHPPKGA